MIWTKPAFFAISLFFMADAWKLQQNAEFGKIMGGEEAIPHEFPWTVMIKINDPDTGFCAGSIIREDIVLTSAQCTLGADSLDLIAGVHKRLDTSEEGHQTREPTRWVEHEAYDEVTLDNDIAIIFLDQPFIFNENISAIPLAEVEPLVSNYTTAAGWGVQRTLDVTLSNYLRKVDVEVASDESAMLNFPGVDFRSKICTRIRDGEGYPDGEGTCYGDRGGPLMTADLEDRQLVGIISFGPQFCLHGIVREDCFSSIPYYLPWINEQIVNNAP